MFMLIMQFTWKYIDDLMGKGLEVSVILELLFYVSASLIPLALPLAILLSSIMTFGNLAENNELTALKSSGLSLFKIMRPLIFVVCLISITTFYFSNYVIPVANLKWHSLIFDIQETKVAVLVTPGSYSKEIDGYAIKVQDGKDNSFTGITIHDYTEPQIVKTIKADSGTIYKSQRGDYLLFQLKNGKIIEELNAQPPIFMSSGRPFHSKGSYRPARRTSFKDATYKMNLMGFNLNRSDQDLFKDEFEMLNVFQIQEAHDSMQRETTKNIRTFIQSRKSERPYFQSLSFESHGIKKPNALIQRLQVIPTGLITIDSLDDAAKLAAITHAASTIRQMHQNLESQRTFMESMQNSNDRFEVEFHRKFALSFAILVLFFVGAPLGAIVRKGGFGAPVVIAALLFMIYFVLFSIGENLATTNSVSPFWGMWMPTLFLTPIAVILMLAAANDLGVFDKKLWIFIFSLGTKR
jgi:lipopolysaccharide export system permease protein